MQKRYTLFLISPKPTYRHLWNLHEVAGLMGKKIFSYPLALPTVAALTPDHYDIRIIDEDMEPLPAREKPDIVGITCMHPSSRRAFAIADGFRAQNIPVVFGGTYATFATDTVLSHADSVVVGEAEGVWLQCLQDFEAGAMKKIYKADKVPEFRSSRPPRWDLVRVKDLTVCGVQISRGCPYSCEFCLVTKMFGNRMRYRDVDNVMEEVVALPKRQIFFVDDNLTADKAYAHELMRRLKGSRISWSCQCSIDVASDAALLTEMAEAGCNGMLIGFESVNQASLTETHKKHNRIAQYEEAIRAVQAAGITMFGSFIVGFDADTYDTYDHIVDFVNRNNLSYAMVSTLTASPGSGLYDRMKREGRLIDVEPELVNGALPCMSYKNMNGKEMVRRYFDALGRMYDYDVLRKKALAVFGGGAFTRKHAGDVSLAEKIRVVISVLRVFYFTKDQKRKRIFKDLVRLGVKKTVYMGKVAEYLIFMEAFNRYIEQWKTLMPEVIGKIKGPA
jgi:radical SAM superfamily enzyme YgiQ (UPF0313 family)